MSTHAATVSPAEVAHVYENVTGRHLADTAAALGISAATARSRLRVHYGAQGVPRPTLRSSGAQLGAAFERRVRDLLTARGWWVIRAAASKGEADLVALRCCRPHLDPVVALVSVKRRTPPGPDEWNGLHELAQDVGGAAVVALMPKAGGVEFMRVVGRKYGVRGKRPPWVEWSP